MICSANGLMIHRGLPLSWAVPILLAIGVIAVWVPFAPAPNVVTPWRIRVTGLPLLGPLLLWLTAKRMPLTLLKVATVCAFLFTVGTGFMGTPIPQYNLATVLTWTVWWTLVVATVPLLGTAWCGICPWNTLARLLVWRRLWGRDESASCLDLKVPRALRSIWPALALLCGLTWLELGVGVTLSPTATATLAVVMVVLSTLSLAVFERGAFCRYFCPVGRTLGCYAQLSPVELRPVNQDLCDRCTTLECYHGTPDVEPCPTALTMGHLKSNTYCLSCGACALACRHGNIGWRLRPMVHEAATGARPHWDEAWFMLGLLALAAFHGLTMLPLWDHLVRTLGLALGDTRLLLSFSLLMGAGLAMPIAVYAAAVAVTRYLAAARTSYRQLFANQAFATLPLAFTYHIAHNLTHLVREGGNLAPVLQDPFGRGPLPDGLTVHLRMLDALAPEPVLFASQAALVLGGFWLAIQILRRRAHTLGLAGSSLIPMVAFTALVSATSVWLLSQDMLMRM